MTRYWNETVATYEQDLEVLEAGRRAYDEACRSLISAVETAARAQMPGLAAELGVELRVWRKSEDGVGQQLCAVTIASASVDWATVLVWIRSAYGGPACMVGVSSRLEAPRDFFADSDAARAIALRAQLGHAVNTDADMDSDSIRVVTLEIANPKVVDDAVAAIGAAVAELAPFVVAWRSHAQLIAKAQRALLLARQRMEKDPVHPEQTLAPSKGWGKAGNARCVTLGGVGWDLWAGYRLEDGALVFEHGADPETPTRASGFIERTSAVPRRRGSYDGGVFMPADAVASADEAKIAARIVEVFRDWVAHCAAIAAETGA